MRSEQTIAIIKPDAVRRNLIGYIVNRIEHERFEILRMRYLIGDILLPGFGRWNPAKFYARQHEGKPYYEGLTMFMHANPVVAMLLQRHDAIDHWRSVMGPWKREDRIPGTIRGNMMLGDDTMQNLVHGSDSTESFVYELSCLEDIL